MKLKPLLALLAICVLAACQKRKYPDEKVQLEDQDVYVNAYIDNEPVALKIGTDGYYCYSSYNQGSDSVYMFEGDLKKFDCNPCPMALRVQLSDVLQRLPGASVSVDEAFGMGSRKFIPGVTKPVTVQLTAHSNKTISAVRWKTEHGFSSADNTLTYEFGQPGLQTVSLTVKSSDNCESVVTTKIFVGSTGDLFACTINANTIQDKLSEFRANLIGGKPPYSYAWNFGDGKTGSSANPSHDYKWVGSYPVNLKITDANNITCEANYIHVAGNDNSSCTANIMLAYAGRRNAALNGAKLQWTDQSNTVLRSDNTIQPEGSYFEVVSSQPYAANERGEPGRLLSLRFNVLLSDGKRSVWFKSDNTSIAVTYK